MITGTVNARRDAVVTLTVFGSSGQSQAVEAVIDTGFNDFLTLPPMTIADLGLRTDGFGRVALGDGSVEFVDYYKAVVIWDALPRIVDIQAADTDPLVGMALMAGHELRIQVVDGGAVTIEVMQ
jgi:clan AA aspartic protease